MRTSTISLVAAALMAHSAFAKVSFNSTASDYKFDGVIPSGVLSKECGAVYAKELSCPELLFELRDQSTGPTLFKKTVLEEFCTSDCIDSLNSWDKELNKTCTDKDKAAVAKLSSGGEYLALALNNAHQIQENLYWTFCLADSAKETDFCLVKSDLPAFPKGEDSSSVVPFCSSSCRVQQSFLINHAAEIAGADISIFESTVCPNVDVSSFKMNVLMLEAFGSSEEAYDAEDTDSKILPGTTYEYTALFGDSGNSTAGNSTSGNSTVIESEGAGARAVVSWGALAVAGVVALII